MFSYRKKITKQRHLKGLFTKVLCFFALVGLASAAFFLTRITFSAGSDSLPDKVFRQTGRPFAAPSPPSTSPTRNPTQTQAQRIKITIEETQDIPFPEEIKTVVVVSAEIASAQIKNNRVLTITARKVGETILIISDNETRYTFVVVVTGKPLASERQNIVREEDAGSSQSKTSGSYSATFAHSFSDSAPVLKQAVEYRHQIAEDKTLRVSAETTKSFGEKDRRRGLAQIPDYAFNRVSIGVDSPGKTIDFLDSRVNFSPISLNNYTMRGFHLVKASKSAPDVQPNSSLSNSLTDKRVEIFAGMARPSLALFADDRGWLAGAGVPVTDGKNWQLRAGLITVIAPKNNRFGSGGTILQLSGAFAPSEKFLADGEIAYATSGLSWRARMDFKRSKFGGRGEIVRFSQSSPLNSIGAQPGGRSGESFAVYFRPDSRFDFSARYNHTALTRRVGSGLADFNRASVLANISFRPNRDSRLLFRFSNQDIETAVPGRDSKFRIETRTFTAAYNQRFNRNLSNNFEARLNFSREPSSHTNLENGFNLSDHLRFSWNGNSVTGFVNHTYKTPSLMSLIVRNPQILPPLLQASYALNPSEFLHVYRDKVASMLSGIDLPQTSGLNAGVSFQASFLRFNLTGETRYNAGEILAQNQKNLLAAFGFGVRLDAANSLQINGRKSIGSVNHSALTFTFTHRFGAEVKGGYNLSKLFGLDKGRIQGRVFYDLNGNGQDDAGEPGVAGKTVQINEKRSLVTDINGRYELAAAEGQYKISLVSEDLGVRLRASTATQRKISLASNQTVKVDFGVTDFGFLSGVVYNDVNLNGEMPLSNVRGLNGVRVVLRAATRAETETFTNSTGAYEFRNLRPGSYTLAIDSATLPADFLLPAQASWEVTVLPLQGFYFDVPIAAQRAVAGVVFIDNDVNGKFNPQIDEIVAGASVTAGGSVAVTDSRGKYFLRNLPAGNVSLFVRSPQGTESSPVALELSVAPETRREVNLAVRR